LQDCISFHLGLNPGTFPLFCIILVGLVFNGKVADLLEILGPESPLNLREDFIFGLLLAQDLDHPAKDSTSINNGSLLEFLCG
jgi:hypothetical protein